MEAQSISSSSLKPKFTVTFLVTLHANIAYFVMSCGLFQLFLSKCRTPLCSFSLWMERTLCTVSSAMGWCWLWGRCSSAHLCHLHKFPSVPPASLPEHGVEHHPRHPETECLSYRFYSSVNV